VPLSLQDMVIKFPLKDVKGKYKQIYDEELKVHQERLENILLHEEHHLELAQSISATFFPGSEIARRTGYEFQFTEPLCETRRKNFDVLISNQRNGSIILVESKTFDDEVKRDRMKDIFKECSERYDTILQEKGVLEQQLSHPVKNIDICMIIEVEKEVDVLRAYNSIGPERGLKPIMLVYDRMGNRINLAEGFHLRDRTLNREFHNGVIPGSEDLRIDLPCMIQGHPFHIFARTILANPVEEIKYFSRDVLENELSKIPLGCSGREKISLISSKVDTVIQHLLRYEIIREEEGRYKIVSTGIKRMKIADAIKDKYIRKWTEKKAKESSLDRLQELLMVDRSLDQY